MKKGEFLSKKIKELEKELDLLKSVKSEEEYFRKKSEEQISYRKQQYKQNKKKSLETIGLWGLYGDKDVERYKSYIIPIFATTAGGSFESLEYGRLLLNYDITNDPDKIYSRIDNTSVDHLAYKIASLEGKDIPELTQGLCLASGISAIFMSTLPFLNAGDNFVSSNRVYGGTQQLFGVTYPKMGWEVRWVKNPQNLDAWREKIDQNTKFLFAEFPSNPTLFCPDIPGLAQIAHEFDLPLIVDSTIASPVLTRPLAHGADIVIHSTTKVMCGSGRTIGGAIVAKEEIVTKAEELKENFVEKLKGGHFRNLGPCMSPYSAKEVWDSLNTLKIRVEALSKNALEIANYLSENPKIERVNYPGLSSHPQHQVARKLMKLPNGQNGYSHLMSFQIKGGIEKAKQFAQTFKFGAMLTDLGRDYTVWVHPASTTHSQMSEEERIEAEIPGNLIRYSVGLEGTEDAIKALDEALSKI